MSLRKQNWYVFLSRPNENGLPPSLRFEKAVARTKTQAELDVILRVPGLWFVTATYSEKDYKKMGLI